MSTARERWCAVVILGGLAAGALAYVATREAGPVPLPKFTEQRRGALEEHLVTAEQLGYIPRGGRMHYPVRVGQGLTRVIRHGFRPAPSTASPDPQVMALPAEED